MHIEVLVEDCSGAKLVETLLPAVLGHREIYIPGVSISTKASAGCLLGCR